MELVIKIDLDNAAFADGGTAELQRVLDSLYGRLPDPITPTHGDLNLYDINGNHVGTARIA